jgi:peptidoglycan/LPS O-acetylase OafA/YrhL
VEGRVDPGTVLSQIFYYYNYWSLHFGPSAHGGPIAYGDGDTIPGLGLLWSLSIEEHFYLIWPALFLFIARKSITLTHVTLLIVAILFWRTFRFVVIGSDAWTIYSSTDTRIDMLLFGCLLALLNWRKDLSAVMPGGLFKYALIGGCCLAILISFAIRDELFRSSLRFTIQGLALMPLFYYAVFDARAPLFQPLNWSALKLLGAYSYTIYLSHHVIILLLLQQGIAKLGEVKMALLAGALTLIYAALMHVLVEKPCHRLRRKFARAPFE